MYVMSKTPTECFQLSCILTTKYSTSRNLTTTPETFCSSHKNDIYNNNNDKNNSNSKIFSVKTV